MTFQLSAWGQDTRGLPFCGISAPTESKPFNRDNENTQTWSTYAEVWSCGGRTSTTEFSFCYNMCRWGCPASSSRCPRPSCRWTEASEWWFMTSSFTFGHYRTFIKCNSVAQDKPKQVAPVRSIKHTCVKLVWQEHKHITRWLSDNIYTQALSPHGVIIINNLRITSRTLGVDVCSGTRS